MGAACSSASPTKVAADVSADRMYDGENTKPSTPPENSPKSKAKGVNSAGVVVPQRGGSHDSYSSSATSNPTGSRTYQLNGRKPSIFSKAHQKALGSVDALTLQNMIEFEDQVRLSEHDEGG
eukprot:CAMPEP_0182457688 /NCGR_PEP_ID=MMETSP1319-20130603/3204_1 /TAXON_ID=172717 /ORGANISM="Bolidomonas pacifica, Strain RCC208" /LENGTH=121 /DNA_ID=CAMNT_0024656207 /DNA_START=415 /DNA_END=780 /DNA_ORIENTATION=-